MFKQILVLNTIQIFFHYSDCKNVPVGLFIVAYNKVSNKFRKSLHRSFVMMWGRHIKHWQEFCLLNMNGNSSNMKYEYEHAYALNEYD